MGHCLAHILGDTVVESTVRHVGIEALEYLMALDGIMKIVDNQPQKVGLRLLVDGAVQGHIALATRRIPNAYVHILIATGAHSIQHSGQQRVAIVGAVAAHNAVLVFDAKTLQIVLIAHQRKYIGQRAQRADAIGLRIALQQCHLGEAEYAFDGIRMPWRYLLHRELCHGGLELITAVRHR